MQKKFITNLALVIILNLLVKPFWIFGIDRTVQNVVGAEQYGFYFALFNFSLILNILLDFGITNFNNRNISQNRQLLNKHFSNIIVLRLMLGVAYFIVCMLAAMFSGYTWNEIQLLLLLVFNQFLISFVLNLRSNLAGLHLFKTDSLISVLDRLLMILICGVLLWGNVSDKPFQIKWFVFAQTAAYGFTAFVAFILVLAKSGRIKVNYDRKFIIAILKKSYPFAILTLLMAFYNRIDSIMLERMLVDGKVQAGIYAQGFRILEAASMFALLFASLLLPIFSKMIKQKQPVGQLAQLSFILLVIPATILAGTCVFFRHEIMELLYYENVAESANIFGILMVGFIGISTTYIFGTLLTANGSLKQLNYMALGGMILNITLNLILIPKFKAEGAAITSLITQGVTAFIQLILAIKIFKLRVNYKLLILLLIFAAGVIIFGIIARDLPYNWVISLSLMIILSIILAFSIGIIKVKGIYQILKYED